MTSVTSFTTNIFRESRRERYCEKNPAAKAKTVRAKAPRKPSRKLFYSRTRSLPGLRRRSLEASWDQNIGQRKTHRTQTDKQVTNNKEQQRKQSVITTQSVDLCKEFGCSLHSALFTLNQSGTRTGNLSQCHTTPARFDSCRIWEGFAHQRQT